MRTVNILAVLLTVVIGAVVLCYRGTLAYTLEESFQKTLPQQEATKLSVSNRNGNIEVSPWQKEEIRIEATKKIEASDKEEAKEYAQELKIEIFREGKEIIIKTIRPEERKGFWGIFKRERKIQAKVDYSILVPEKLDLDLRSRNGSIKASGTQGDVTGETRNGSISFSEITGSVKAKTRNGKVQVDGADGDVSAESRNGSISLLKIGGSVNASTRNGNISTEITGESFQGCDLGTRNASITLIVPEDLSADVDAYTRNGSINTELTIKVLGDSERGKLRGQINQGGPLVKLWTRNGNINIKKAG